MHGVQGRGGREAQIATGEVPGGENDAAIGSIEV
jgi:hypothetical protein